MTLKWLVWLPMILMWGWIVRPVAAQSPNEHDNGLRLRSSDEGAIVLELTVSDFEMESVERNGEAYQRLLISGMTQTSIPGEPQVPTLGILLGVPTTGGISINILDADIETLTGTRFPLALRPSPARDEAGEPIAGSSDPLSEPAINGPVSVGEVGYLRDQAVAQLQFYPALPDTGRSEITLYRRLAVEVTWNEIEAISPRSQTSRFADPAYETLLQTTLFNYDTLHRPTAETPTAPARMTAGQTANTLTPTLKIGVAEDGLVRLTGQDLTEAGFEPDTLNPQWLRLTNRGADVPFLLQGTEDGVFNRDDALLFYGTANSDIYTAQNSYWLAETGNGHPMPTRSGEPTGSNLPVAGHFPTTLHAEENTFYWQTMPNGEGQDHWFWGSRLTAPLSRTQTLTVSHISTAAVTATLRATFKGYTFSNHRTRLTLNGIDVGEQSWQNQAIFTHTATIAHADLRNGANAIGLELAADDAPVDQVLLNAIELDYWDTYTAEDDHLIFGAPEAGRFRFEVTGFSQADIWGFDITDPAYPMLITGTTVISTDTGYTLQFEDTAQTETRYLALTTARQKKPAALERDRPSAWKSPEQGADYLIITHRDFYTATLPLAQHHRDAGLRVAVVDVGDIYDEFNHGIFNPGAIRDFVSTAYHTWQSPAPVYLLLVGDAYQDYRDNFRSGGINYVPSQIVQTDLLGETPSDNWFATVSGPDILPDLFAGRLSGQTAAHVEAMVSKIIRYEESPPAGARQTEALLVADDDDFAFEAMSEGIAALLPDDTTANRLYATAYPPGDLTADIVEQVNRGQMLVNYAGHGSATRWGMWAEGPIFEATDIDSLTNADALPVVTIGNCLNGFFAGSQSTVSMAEAWQRPADKGAIAVWATSGVSYPSGHQALLSEFYRTLFDGEPKTLGAATTTAKVETYAQSNLWGEMVETFILFGDPAMRLPLVAAAGPGAHPVYLPLVVK